MTKAWIASHLALVVALILVGNVVCERRAATRDLARRTGVLRDRAAALRATVEELRATEPEYAVRGVRAHLDEAAGVVDGMHARVIALTSQVDQLALGARLADLPMTEAAASCDPASTASQIRMRGHTGLDVRVRCKVAEPNGHLEVRYQVSGIRGTIAPFNVVMTCAGCARRVDGYLPLGNGTGADVLDYVGVNAEVTARLILICPGPATVWCDVAFQTRATP